MKRPPKKELIEKVIAKLSEDSELLKAVGELTLDMDKIEIAETQKPDTMYVLTGKIMLTTRSKRSNETEGVDYYYITKEQFYQHQIDGSLVEYELYDGEYYGTLFAEVERHYENTPLILVIDARGRRNVSMRFPMAKSIFIVPPSFEALKARILARNENTPDEIEHRLTVAKEELEQASYYDYTVVNDDLESCVSQIANIMSGNV